MRSGDTLTDRYGSTRRTLLQAGLSAAAFGAPLLRSGAARAEASELRIAKQPGLSYLPAVIAEKLGLVETHAKAAGIDNLKVTWTRLTNGGASNDALLSGGVDMVISGGPNMLIMWARPAAGSAASRRPARCR